MLEANRRAILSRLSEDALVLDVGGGAQPFERADWVLDLMPYAERGTYGPPARPEQEWFSVDTWVVRDMCAREPWPFADRQFDFAVCSHTLEDVRDPIWVCGELVRVARAGYIEVPSRLEEQSYGFQGPWAGYSHHHWLVDIEGDEISFVFKHHVIHNRPANRFSADFRWALAPELRVQAMFWDGGFRPRERVLLSAADVDGYLSGFVAANRPPRPPLQDRALARLRWLRDRPGQLLRSPVE